MNVLRIGLMIVGCLVLTGCPNRQTPPSETVFGTTQAPQPQNPTVASDPAVEGNTLSGSIYLLEEGTNKLPDFSKLISVGKVYTLVFNIVPRPFDSGFPGITSRFEWFALDYQGQCRFEVGKYKFRLESDDGAKLYINNQLLIDNDGIHSMVAKELEVDLPAGRLPLRLSYFQGPRFEIGLRLLVNSSEGLLKVRVVQ